MFNLRCKLWLGWAGWACLSAVLQCPGLQGRSQSLAILSHNFPLQFFMICLPIFCTFSSTLELLLLIQLSSLWRSVIAVRDTPAPSPARAGWGWVVRSMHCSAAPCCRLVLAACCRPECCRVRPVLVHTLQRHRRAGGKAGLQHLHSSTPARHRRVSAHSTGGCSV